MPDLKARVWLGLLSGILISVGLLGVPALVTLMGAFLSFHHMFIMGVEKPLALLILALPILLVAAGVFTLTRALRVDRD